MSRLRMKTFTKTELEWSQYLDVARRQYPSQRTVQQFVVKTSRMPILVKFTSSLMVQAVLKQIPFRKKAPTKCRTAFTHNSHMIHSAQDRSLRRILSPELFQIQVPSLQMSSQQRPWVNHPLFRSLALPRCCCAFLPFQLP